MKTYNEGFLMVAVALVALLVVATVGFQMVTDRNRDAAVARFKGSPAIERYRRTRSAEAKNVQAAPARGQSQSSSETPAPSTPPSESIAAFAEAFSKAKALQAKSQWTESEQILVNKPAKEWTDEDWARAKSMMDEAHDLIHEIRRLAEMGGPAYELDFSKGIYMELPHLAQLRELARLLREDALVQTRGGNYGEAVEDIMAGMKLATALKDEPILISQLVRSAMDGIACQAAQEALPPEGISPDLARMLIEYAGRIGCREGFADSFSSEGFFGLDAFGKIRDGEIGYLFDMRSNLPTPPSTWEQMGLRLYGSAFARPLLNMDEEAYAETIARIGDASRLPYYEAKPLLVDMEHEIDGMSRIRVVSHTMLPFLTRAAESQARTEANLGLLRVGLSLEQYHMQNGTYPTTLDAVASGLGGSVPVDPFTGQPFVYKPSGGSFLLYSVGVNAVDDGARFDYMTGDIVWRGVLEKRAEKSQIS